MRKLFGALSLLSLSLSLNAVEISSEANVADVQAGIFDNFSPLAPVNKYDLMLTVGMDDLLDTSAVTYGPQEFLKLGWDQAKIDTFRNAAIQWFLERFGIDFTNGYYDAASGTVSIPEATMSPLSCVGKYRVLQSNSFSVLPYSALTPTVIEAYEYVVFFNGIPFNYGGTYANGAATEGRLTDTLSYCLYKVIHNRSGSNSEFVWMRSLFPSTNENPYTYPSPVRTCERSQLYSVKHGSGFCVINSGLPLTPDANGKYPSYVHAMWNFPGSFLIPEYNGFTSAPLVP